MAYTEARNKASQRYQREKMEQIPLRVMKGDKERMKAVADQAGASVRAYIIDAVNEKAGFQVLTPPDTSD